MTAAYTSRYQRNQNISILLEMVFGSPLKAIQKVLCSKAVTKGAETYFMAFTGAIPLALLYKNYPALKETSIHLPL
jgi:hypothetical protein